MFDLHLPTIEIIAGDTCPFVFHVQDIAHMDVTTRTCSAYFSISPYVYESEPPVVSKSQTSISAGELTFDIAPQETASLRGKYVYQLAISNGRQSEIYSGYLIIHANRNPSVLST